MNVAFDATPGVGECATCDIPQLANRLKGRQQPWALVVDENYGEGSAREHAALQPRYFGWSCD